MKGEQSTHRVFGQLHFTMLRSVLAWHALWNVWTVYSFNFQNFFPCAVKRE